MTLSDLPQFTVERVGTAEEGKPLYGNFDRLTGVLEGWACLFSWTEPLIGDLQQLDPERRTAVFSPFADEVIEAKSGAVYPWIPGYWQAHLVRHIADPQHVWTLTTFQPSDALAFLQDGARGWVKASEGLPEGVEPAGIIPNGWDHEHCEICEIQINTDEPTGYIDAEGEWLCPACYERWAATHDVGFLEE